MNVVVKIKDLVSNCPWNTSIEFCQVVIAYDLLKDLHPDQVGFVEREDYFFHKRLIAQKICKILHIWPDLLTEFKEHGIFKDSLKTFTDGFVVMDANTGELLEKPEEV